MKTNKKRLVVDGVTEVDDLTLVSHYANTESSKIQELLNFKKAHSDSAPKPELNLSHFCNAGDDSDGTDSDVGGLDDVLSSPKREGSEYVAPKQPRQASPQQKDPPYNLRMIDTVDLPDKVADELPIEKIGKCKSSFEDILVIESFKVLDLGSIVCREDRTILGTVNDTFGQTTCPYYMVILHKPDLKVQEEECVYYDVTHSTYVTDDTEPVIPPNVTEESEDEKMDEPEDKSQKTLKQSYKDL